MRGSLRLSSGLAACALALVVLAAGCGGGRRRGGVSPSPDGGTGTIDDDLGPGPDGAVPPPPDCGDYTVDASAGEQCDDGPTGSSACDVDCTFASCGDFTVNSLAGEDCDTGGSPSLDCDLDCTYSSCGDGTVNTYGEACDDGDLFSGDGCDATCSVEAGWTCAGAPSSCTRAGGATIDRSASPGLAIPDASTTGVSSTISLTGSPASTCTVASITVDVDITHTYIGDLRVGLTSPGGVLVELHAWTGGATDNILGNYPTTLTPSGSLSAFTGVAAAGSWTLNVADTAASDAGTLNSWGLHITCL